MRSEHAERDDRVFAWDHEFADGTPGQPFNCRCFAEPAVVDGRIILTARPIDADLARRINRARTDGLTRAAADAAIGTVTGALETLRFSYLGYRRLFGVITPEEEAERQETRAQIQAALEALSELDAETATQIATEATEYVEAIHADLILLDLEYRLGLTSEQALLRAYEDVSHLDGSLLLGGTAFAAGAARLGIGLTRLRPARALTTLRNARLRLDGLVNARRREITKLIDRRFGELSAQGHGPQRHDGDVTRQMLIDRAMRGIDPMIHTDPARAAPSGLSPTRHATRIKARADYVAAEAYISRSEAYRDARDLAIRRISEGNPQLGEQRVGDGIILNNNGRFEVRLPLREVLGPNAPNLVEGVSRIGSLKNPSGFTDVDFSSGIVIARYKFLRGPGGDLLTNQGPQLITLFPEGAK